MRATKCRGCHSPHLEVVHDFGEQPLAGSYPTAPNSLSPERKYPLDLTQCRTCGLLQVTFLPPIDQVFHDDYRYSSSTVPALVRHFEEYATWLGRHLKPNAKVLEFGCNDGVLLLPMQRMGYLCGGIDASDNVAAIARSKGLDVVTGFLSSELVTAKGYAGKFDLVTCSNVFAHIHDLDDTLNSVRLLLVKGGLFSVEVHDGESLYREGQFDTLYHEHLTYFTETTLRELLERQGFEFVACDKTAMHGGGLRLIARYSGNYEPGILAKIPPVLIGDFAGSSIKRCRDDLEKLYREHGPLVGYGAAGRSQMFLNMTQAANWFSHVYDDSPLRQGRFIAATDLQIRPYNNEEGDGLVILAWNYASDILKKIERRYRNIYTVLPELTRY